MSNAAFRPGISKFLRFCSLNITNESNPDNAETETGTLKYYFIVNSGLKLVHFFQNTNVYVLDVWLTLAIGVHAQYE